MAKDSKTESVLRRENDDLKKRLKRKRDDCKFFAGFISDPPHIKYRRPSMYSIRGIISIAAAKGKFCKAINACNDYSSIHIICGISHQMPQQNANKKSLSIILTKNRLRSLLRQGQIRETVKQQGNWKMVQTLPHYLYDVTIIWNKIVSSGSCST